MEENNVCPLDELVRRLEVIDNNDFAMFSLDLIKEIVAEIKGVDNE